MTSTHHRRIEPAYADLNLDDAERRDAANPIAHLHDQFVASDDGTIYLDGNSLGRLPKATVQALSDVVRIEWGQQLIRSWPQWIERATDISGRLATSVLEVDPREVVIADSTTVNLYKVINAALDLRPERTTILIERDNFPTDHYVIQGIAKARGLQVRIVESDIDEGLSEEHVIAALDDSVALACFCHVSYRSGAIADMVGITEELHDSGALVLWDLCHSAGAVRTPLTQAKADFAVGCTYKYLNAGPGAPAFIYARRDLHAQIRQPIWGWFGQQDQFGMGLDYEPVEGVEQMLSGTPPVLGITAVGAGVATIESAGIGALEATGRALTDYAIDLADAWLGAYGVTVASPRDATRRGSHVILHHRQAWQLTQALISHDVVPDFRTPDRIRLGFAPLTTAYADIWRAMDRLRSILESEEHLAFPAERARVT